LIEQPTRAEGESQEMKVMAESSTITLKLKYQIFPMTIFLLGIGLEMLCRLDASKPKMIQLLFLNRLFLV